MHSKFYPADGASLETPVRLFVGPTLHSVEQSFLSRTQILLMPPVQSGDLDALLEEDRRPGRMIIADGIQSPGASISPAEVQRVIAAGWELWGVASTGAMLAAEMRNPSMRGYGFIFRCFLLEKNFSDDDIALLHASSCPYAPLSEPFIHQRLLLEHLVATGAVTATSKDRILAQIKRARLAERTLSQLGRLLVELGGLTEPHSRRAVEQTLSRFRMKTRDLVKFLHDHFVPNGRANVASAHVGISGNTVS